MGFGIVFDRKALKWPFVPPGTDHLAGLFSKPGVDVVILICKRDKK